MSILSLPDELLYYIMGKLPKIQLAIAGLTCVQWRRVELLYKVRIYNPLRELARAMATGNVSQYERLLNNKTLRDALSCYSISINDMLRAKSRQLLILVNPDNYSDIVVHAAAIGDIEIINITHEVIESKSSEHYYYHGLISAIQSNNQAAAEWYRKYERSSAELRPVPSTLGIKLMPLNTHIDNIDYMLSNITRAADADELLRRLQLYEPSRRLFINFEMERADDVDNPHIRSKIKLLCPPAHRIGGMITTNKVSMLEWWRDKLLLQEPFDSMPSNYNKFSNIVISKKLIFYNYSMMEWLDTHYGPVFTGALTPYRWTLFDNDLIEYLMSRGLFMHFPRRFYMSLGNRSQNELIRLIDIMLDNSGGYKWKDNTMVLVSKQNIHPDIDRHTKRMLFVHLMFGFMTMGNSECVEYLWSKEHKYISREYPSLTLVAASWLKDPPKETINLLSSLRAMA